VTFLKRNGRKIIEKLKFYNYRAQVGVHSKFALRNHIVFSYRFVQEIVKQNRG